MSVVRRTAGIAAGLVALATMARAETINVSASDSAQVNIGKIQAAVAGDVVEIGPGTYEFVVVLSTSGTAAEPIVIRAADPNDKPIFDLDAYGHIDTDQGPYAGLGMAPHDATHGGWRRAAFFVNEAGHIDIEDIRIRNVHNSNGDANGLRIYAAGGPVNIRRSEVILCDNGIDTGTGSGSGDDVVTVTACELAYNGRVPSVGLPGHNVYTHGGTTIVEHSYLHDPTEGQNLHLRSKTAIVRHNWIDSAFSYTADMSSDREDELPFVQRHTYLGNVIVESPNQANGAQSFVIMEGDDRGVEQELRLCYNSFVGNSLNQALVHVAPDASQASALLYNNIFWGNTRPLRDDPAAGSTVDIRRNWWPGSEGDYAEFAAVMSDNLFGPDPGFRDLTGADYSLREDAETRGQADNQLCDPAPDQEYVVHLGAQARPTALDLGAFEFATPPATCSELAGTCCPSNSRCEGGAFEPSSDCGPWCCVGGTCGGGGAGGAGGGSGTAGGGADPGLEPDSDRADDGCGCRLAARRPALSGALLAVIGVLLVPFVRRSTRGHRRGS